MRAKETQKWLLYLLLPPSSLAAFAWALIRHIQAYTTSPSVFKDLAFMNGEVGAVLFSAPYADTYVKPSGYGPGQTATTVFAAYIPLLLQMFWPLAVVIWLAALTFSPFGSSLLSIRGELRALFVSTTIGLSLLLWSTIGDSLMLRRQVRRTGGWVRFTSGQIVAYVMLALLTVSLGLNYTWLLVYARRHYGKSEWGQSLDRLNSFVTQSEVEYKDGDSMYTRSEPDTDQEEAIVEEKAGVTPFVNFGHAPMSASGKSYDAPPDAPPYVPHTPPRTGPSYSGLNLAAPNYLPSTVGPSSSVLSPASPVINPQSTWRVPETAEGNSCHCCTSCGYAAEKAKVLRLDMWDQGDGYRREKRRNLEGEFGLYRTRSL